jgi:hypothetical protein
MLETVASFLTSLEKALRILSEWGGNRRRLFDTVIQPLFCELEPVVDDYYGLFCRCHDRLQSRDPTRLEEVRREISAMRDSQIVVRSKVKELARSLYLDTHDPQVERFAKLIGDIFEVGDPTRMFGRQMSRAKKLIEEISENEIRENFDRYQLIRSVIVAKEEVEQAWIAVVQSYGYLRLRFAR